MIRVREFDMEKDAAAVEEMERRCEVGSTTTTAAASADGGGGDKVCYKNKSKKKKKNSMSLYVDLLGDPMCRIRHAPDHVMMVAEYGEKKEMVGVIRACIKMVTRGREPTSPLPHYVKVAYILGLRVSPTHRRRGIGTKLAVSAESWCVQNGAEYSYIATSRSNSPSLNLFTSLLSYSPFRSPSILTHPVLSHPLPLPSPSSTTLLRLPPSLSSLLYSHLLSPSSEFLPSDFPSLLSHPLTLSTFLSFPSSSSFSPSSPFPLPPSFAIMSLWNSTPLFKLRVSGVPRAVRTVLGWARALDERTPSWLHVPSVRDVFKPFGIYIMYGLYMRGEEGKGLMRGLCRLAHNLAMEDGECAAVVAEVGREDPVREAVPHWKRLSCEEDVWCMKRLVDGGGDGDDWSKVVRPSTNVLFVDPREF